MNRGKEIVDNFLAHYASEYYDPAKAHEYYLKNRELKGKQSSSGLTVKYTQAGKVSKTGKVGKSVQKVNRERTDERQQAWAYAKNQIGEKKNAELDGLSEQRRQVVDSARATTKALREEISNKLKNILELLVDNRSDTAESITAEAEAAVERLEQQQKERQDSIRQRAQKRSTAIREAAMQKVNAIPPVPDNVTGERRERLLAARDKKIARINGDASKEIGQVTTEAALEIQGVADQTKIDRKAIGDDAAAKRETLSAQTEAAKAGERDEAAVNRERVATELKTVVEKARVDYEAGKARLIAEYEVKQQAEYDAIRTRV